MTVYKTFFLLTTIAWMKLIKGKRLKKTWQQNRINDLTSNPHIILQCILSFVFVAVYIGLRWACYVIISQVNSL